MEAVAKLNNVPTAPRKMRMVADLIRGERVNTALNILKFEPKEGAARLEKLLLSAISNWQAKNEDERLEDADLFLHEVCAALDLVAGEDVAEIAFARSAPGPFRQCSASRECFPWR